MREDFFPIIFVIANQVDPFQAVPIEDVEGGPGALELGADIWRHFCSHLAYIFAFFL